MRLNRARNLLPLGREPIWPRPCRLRAAVQWPAVVRRWAGSVRQTRTQPCRSNHKGQLRIFDDLSVGPAWPMEHGGGPGADRRRQRWPPGVHRSQESGPPTVGQRWTSRPVTEGTPSSGLRISRPRRNNSTARTPPARLARPSPPDRPVQASMKAPNNCAPGQAQLLVKGEHTGRANQENAATQTPGRGSSGSSG